MPALLLPLHPVLAQAAESGSLVTRLAVSAEPWRSAYADSKALPLVVVFTHLASLLVGGGLAIAADRAALRAHAGTPTDRVRHIEELGYTHRPVVAALAMSAASGVALFFSDVEEFAASPLFWAKMALVVALLVNGWWMTRLERSLRTTTVDEAAGWRRLRSISITSVALWLLTLLAGTALANG